MSHYINLSDKPVQPITESDINNKNKQNQSGFLSGLFKKKQSVKPITANNLTSKSEAEYQAEYYRMFGIMHTGSDLGSCINSLF